MSKITNFEQFRYYPPRFEYDLLAKFLIEKRGYDEAIKVQSFDSEVDFVCKVNSIGATIWLCD